jgi:hypothetical protein
MTLMNNPGKGLPRDYQNARVEKWNNSLALTQYNSKLSGIFRIKSFKHPSMENDLAKQQAEGLNESSREGLGASGFDSTRGTQTFAQPAFSLTSEPMQLMRSQDEPGREQEKSAVSGSDTANGGQENTRQGGISSQAGPMQLQDATPAEGSTGRRGRLRSGPTYTPNGTIAASSSGSMKRATFNLSADFDHDPANGIYASCCEVRQYIKWSAGETSPNHAGFRPASNFSTNTWYEDRDGADKRYGHRSGSQSDPQSFDQYLDAAGTRDQANGARYRGSDSPLGASSRTGLWYFRMDVVDVCNSNQVLGSDNVAVDW